MAKPIKTGDEDKAKPKGEDARKAALIERARKRYKELDEYWAENKKHALEDIKFRAGDQWPEAIKKERDDDNRPCLVLDKINQYLRQVVNDGRQNRPAIKYRPKGDGDDKVADAFQGLSRSILMASNADHAFDTALDHAAGHGFGFFRVITDYMNDRSFDQEIRIERVRNPLSVLLSPHQAADGSDAEDGFVVDTMTKSAFKVKWPDAKKTDWKRDESAFGEGGWISKDEVRVVEYWYKEPAVETVYLLADGVTVTKDEYEKAQAEGVMDIPPVINRREARVEKVKWCRMSGAEILEERDWPGRYIPIIPVYGTETDINGRVAYSGLTRLGRDGQMLYNFARTAFAERVALTPKSPWVAAAGQTEDDPNWNTAHSKNHPVLTYNPVEVNGTVLPRPSRESAADIPAGFAQEMQHAEHDIQSALGMYAASVGQPSNEKSGRAIMARQREGDVATFHYHDNLNRAIRYLGRILLDLIPKVYDSKRVVRLLAEDGEATEAIVTTQELPGGVPYAKEGGLEIYNLGAGEYDVEVDTGPSYTTKRQEALDAQLELAKGNPNVLMTHGDLIARNFDWPGAEEWAKRAKALMPPEMKAAIAAAEQEDEGVDPKVREVVEAAQAEIDKREQALQQAQQIVQEAQAAAQAAAEQVAQAEEKAKTAMADAQRECNIEEQRLEIARREAAVKEADAKTRRMQARVQARQAMALPPDGMAEGEGEGADDMLEEDKLNALVDAVAKIAADVEVIGGMVEQLAEHADATPEVLRDETGEAVGVRKGVKEFQIVRGADGRPVGLQ